MAFISHFFKKIFIGPVEMDEELEEDPVPKYTFPDTLEEFGYYFNDKGELRDRETDEKFKFVIKDDHNYNQQRYDALGELVTEYLYQKMEKELHLQRVYIPLDARKDDPQSFVFISRNAMYTTDKLLVLIHGGGAVRAGQWSRKLIINENIDTGSQLPYISRAIQEGFEVIVCNPNINQLPINGKKCNIKGNKTPEEHGFYIWQHFLRAAKAQHIAIVAHSYGGIVTMHMIQKYLEEMKDRVFAVCFTDSVHTMQRHQWIPPTKSFIKERGVNFGASYMPLNTELQISDEDDCTSVSAGTQEHERTSHSSIDLVFTFIGDNYKTWSRHRGFAPRHFLPLPEDLSPYAPASRWNFNKKEAEMKILNESEAGKKDGDKKSEERKSSSVDEAISADDQKEVPPVKDTQASPVKDTEEADDKKNSFVEGGDRKAADVEKPSLQLSEGAEKVSKTGVDTSSPDEAMDPHVEDTAGTKQADSSSDSAGDGRTAEGEKASEQAPEQTAEVGETDQDKSAEDVAVEPQTEDPASTKHVDSKGDGADDKTKSESPELATEVKSEL